MSIDGTKLLFEGFLQKRKDTMKIRWVTYWFRLQNTTLFFYTKKDGSASHLRGNYYIYTLGNIINYVDLVDFIHRSVHLLGQVQSVREVQRADSKRFMFEIIMTNGKRKLLAAETAALRQEWVGYLWQAMHLSTSGASGSRSTHLEMCEQRERINSSAPICSPSDSVMGSLPARPLSAPAPAADIPHEIRSVTSPIYLTEGLNNEETTYQTTLPACNYQCHNGDSLNSCRWLCGSNNEGGQEGDYDVLPVRKKICEIKASTEMDRDVYDFPLSYRRTAEHLDPTESIYDVPSSLLRTTSDHSLDFSSEEQLEDGRYWRI